MGLRSYVARRAARRPHVLLVEVPGGRRVRMSLERELDRRGWVRATSPADADVLIVTGDVPPELREAVELTWQQLPGPRTRLELTDPGAVDDGLRDVVAHLADDRAQRAEAAARPVDEALARVEGDEGDMAPAGIPLAEGAEDRDGLEMDALHVPLGPVLDHWPAGLVLCTVLHGDVVVDVEVAWVGSGGPVEPLPAGVAALDAAASVLALAGDPRRASRAARLRDAHLDGPAGDDFDRDLARLREEVRRSRLLRASLESAAPVLVSLLVAAADRPAAVAPLGDLTSAELAERLRGRDLGEVRLLVAALAPRLRPETARA